MDKKYCPYCMNPVKEGESCQVCGLTEGVYAPLDHHLPLGTVLNQRYLVGRVLGEGGFGITYIGCDLRLELKVAIKEYFPVDKVFRYSKTSIEVSNYAHAMKNYVSGKEKFLKEAQTMARLDKQPRIVSVRDFFEENNTAYIVMEYVEGTTFKELVNQRGGRIPAGELLYLLEPLFPAINVMHKLGLIHRDISPDNLMLEKGEVKLLDFGCAREASSQSETLTIALKQGYAPIEQYQHRGQGPWTDVYALSATIYYCLTGRTPQSAVDRLEEDELIPPRKLGVDLTAKQEEALLRGMNVYAKARYQSIEELHAALYTGAILKPPVKKFPWENSGKEAARTGKAEKKAAVPAETSGGISAENSGEVSGEDSEETLREVREESSGKRFPGGGRTPRKLLAGAVAALAVLVVIAGIGGVLLKNRDDSSIQANAGRNPCGNTGTLDIPKEESSEGNEESPEGSAESSEGNSESSEGSAETSGDGAGSSEEGGQEGLPDVEELFANHTLLEKFDAESLQALMEDDGVESIAISCSSPSDSAPVIQMITITKPVWIMQDTFLQPLTYIDVAGENALLWLDGSLGSNSLLRTEDGGRIVLGAQCDFDSEAMEFLLEEEENLVILNETSVETSRKEIYGKEEKFQNAVVVTEEDAFWENLEAGRNVIVQGEVSLGRPASRKLPQALSILVDEGAVLSVTESSGFEMNAGMFLWNKGTIQGHLATEQEGSPAGTGQMMLLNDGVMDTDGGLCLYGGMKLYNLGQISVTDELSMRLSSEGASCRFLNAGALLLGQSASRNALLLSSECESLINYGNGRIVFDHVSAGYVFPDFDIINYGDLRIEEGSDVTLISSVFCFGDGAVTLAQDAVFHNHGFIYMFSGDLDIESGDFDNYGGEIYFLHAAYAQEADNRIRGGLVSSASSGKIVQENPESTVSVSSAQELSEALSDPKIDKIYIYEDVRWDRQDVLVIGKEVEVIGSLLMCEGSELRVEGNLLYVNGGLIRADQLTVTHGGCLTGSHGRIELVGQDSALKLGNVEGERGYAWTDALVLWSDDVILRNSGEPVRSDFHGGKLQLYDNAMAVAAGEDLQDVNVQIRGNACLTLIRGSRLAWNEKGGVEVSDGGRLNVLSDQNWEKETDVTIGAGGILSLYKSLNMEKGRLEIKPDGKWEMRGQVLVWGPELSVVNDGLIDVMSGEDSIYLYGTMENNGEMELSGCELVISTPEGSVTPACLNNQGVIVLKDGARIQSDEEGFKGKEAVSGGE